MADDRIRLAVRVYLAGIKQSEERIDVDADDLGDVIPQLAEKHAAMMSSSKGMVEIEFLDELDPSVRFFRLGTDPDGMVNPVAVDPARPTDVLSKWGGFRK